MNYARTKMLVSSVILLAVFSVTAFAQCSEAEKNALIAFDKQWGEMSEKGDRAALERIYADGYVNIGMLDTGGSKAEAIDEAVAAAEARKTTPPEAGTPEPLFDNYIVACTPNTATITHRIVMKSGQKTMEKTNYGRVIHVLEKRDGRWQAVSSTGHPMDKVGYLIYKEIDGYQAYMKRDLEWFEKNTADSYMGVGLDGQPYNKAKMLEMMKKDQNKYASVKLSDVDVQVNGEMAVMTGVYHIKGTDPDGKPIDMKMRFTRTLAEEGGRWRAVAGQSTPINGEVN